MFVNEMKVKSRVKNLKRLYNEKKLKKKKKTNDLYLNTNVTWMLKDLDFR